MAIILVHPVVIVLDNPSRLELLNPLGGKRASQAAWVAVLALAAIGITSIFRERLRLKYEWWRLSHLLLGVVAIGASQVHVSLAGLYTNTAWKQAIWIGTAVAMVGLVLYLRLLKPALQGARRWRVAEIRPERGATHTLVLEPVGHPGMRFVPGQFAWIKLSRSPFTLEEHPYSFSSSAERADRIEFGIRALGDFSAAVREVPVGSAAYVDGPHGAFSIDLYQAPAYVFIAGGVGITPFLSLLSTMADRGDPRPVMLIYAAESWSEVTYREELEHLKRRLQLEILYVLEEVSEGVDAEAGYITAEVLEKHLPEERFTRFFFICGPPPMMDAVNAALLERGVPEAHVQLEKFKLA